MKILIYTINYKPELTGIGKYSAEMAEWLKKSGHDIRVVTAPPYYPLWKVSDGWSKWFYQSEVINDVKVSRCPLYVPAKPSGIKRIIHLASFALSSSFKIMSHYFWSPDIVLVIEPPLFCSPVALLLTKLTGAKSMLHIQDFEVDAAFDLGLLKTKKLKKLVLLFEKTILNKFDCVSTISSKMIEKLTNKNVDKKKQFFFPNWVDTSLISPLDEPSEYLQELGIPDSTHVLLYSGNMGNKQGLDIIIDAAKLLINEKDIIFVMCGSGSAKEELIEKSNMLSNIIWLDFQPLSRLNHLLGLATIHLLPQSKEAADLVMPSKLTGMLSSGRPIIATAEQSTQLASVVKKCGITVDPGDVNGFVEAILSLLASNCSQYGEEARKIAVEELDTNSVLNRLECKLMSLKNSND